MGRAKCEEEQEQMKGSQERDQFSPTTPEIMKAIRRQKHKTPGTNGIIAEPVEYGGDKQHEEILALILRTWK